MGDTGGVAAAAVYKSAACYQETHLGARWYGDWMRMYAITNIGACQLHVCAYYRKGGVRMYVGNLILFGQCSTTMLYLPYHLRLGFSPGQTG